MFGLAPTPRGPALSYKTVTAYGGLSSLKRGPGGRAAFRDDIKRHRHPRAQHAASGSADTHTGLPLYENDIKLKYKNGAAGLYNSTRTRHLELRTGDTDTRQPDSKAFGHK